MTLWQRCREFFSSRLHPSDAELVAWILEEEQGAPRHARHASRCPQCQRRSQRFRQTLAMLEKIWPHPQVEEEEVRNLRVSLMERLRGSASPVSAAIERRLLGKAAGDPRYHEAIPEILRTLVGQRALAQAGRRDIAAGASPG